MYQETRPSYFQVIALTIVAIAAFLVLVWFDRQLMTSIAVFLSIEGTVLLACSIQPDDPTLNKSWHERLMGTEFAAPVAYSPLFFYSGLLLLAAAAFVSAFSQ